MKFWEESVIHTSLHMVKFTWHSIEQVSSSGKAFGLYLGGAQSESQSGHQLLLLRFFMVSFGSSRQFPG
jgi:hypothetical protein